MCELCSENDKERHDGRKHLEYQAEQLEEMATHLRRLSDGVVKPHSEAAKIGGVMARAIVRYLVAEYV